jgi:hypothetical protein
VSRIRFRPCVRLPVRALGGDESLLPHFTRPNWEDAVEGPSRSRTALHVSLTRVNTGDQPIENATIVGEEMLRWFRETEGFQGLIILSHEGESIGFTFWESREVAERHLVSRLQFRDRMMAAAGVEVQETVDYELTFADLGALQTNSED